MKFSVLKNYKNNYQQVKNLNKKYKYKYKNKKSFTLIEILFVIIILSVIYTNSFNYILNYYNNFLSNRNNFYSKLTIENTFLFLKNRDFIPETVNFNYIDFNNNDLQSISWYESEKYGKIGNFDDDKSYILPYWSAIINLNETTKIYATTPFSYLSKESSILRNIYNTNLSYCGLYFDKNILNIKKYSGEKIYFSNKDTKMVFDRYKLIFSAYSIIYKDENLYFYYDYQPWLGDTIFDAKQALLLDNVTSFKKIDNKILIEKGVNSSLEKLF
jgi:hypothetical protein